jgi:hypothetical protein
LLLAQPTVAVDLDSGDSALGDAVLVTGQALHDRSLPSLIQIRPGQYIHSSRVQRTCARQPVDLDDWVLFSSDPARCEVLSKRERIDLEQYVRQVSGRSAAGSLQRHLEEHRFLALSIEASEQDKLSRERMAKRAKSCTCPGVSTFTVGGLVTGLVGGQVVLQNNGANNQTVTFNSGGGFTFPAQTDGSSYAVSVLTQPVNPPQFCEVVANATGQLNGANVTNVQVTCAEDQPGQIGFRIGGLVSGLDGSGLILQNNGGDDLAVPAGANDFTFSTTLTSGSDYSVTVSEQPDSPSQTCEVTGGSGAVGNDDVLGIGVNCETDRFFIGGEVAGLEGDGLVLQNNDEERLTVSTNGSFAFTTKLLDQSAYDVRVVAQPENQTCSVDAQTATGVLSGSDISNIAVTCRSNAAGGNAAPVGDVNCSAQTRRAGSRLAPIDFSAVDSDGDLLTGLFSHTIDDGSAIQGLPASLSQSCDSLPGDLSCRVAGTTPDQAGTVQLIWTVSDGIESVQLTSTLQVKGNAQSLIFRDSFVAPACD